MVYMELTCMLYVDFCFFMNNVLLSIQIQRMIIFHFNCIILILIVSGHLFQLKVHFFSFL